ncbi:hypothetical protein ABL78_7545 [Leptomonas seymouri]|uniref:Uncharacterized protein n=1 Tax=Leptomonas seymouri TaxID=5684 RepID=A0A0N1HTU3_LEPSE|nr:hypothetical protein ABL78_7545 [Leptomonas seymouri]|eukprot:KPI83418.1 hypothetical protein ABL78_7545 [Leptomonas seymouri]
MWYRALLLQLRRSRSSRVVHRTAIAVAVSTLVLASILCALSFTSLGNGDRFFPLNSNFAGNPAHWSGDRRSTAPNGGASAGVAVTTSPDAIPYSETIDELLKLLYIYTAARGIVVNTSVLDALNLTPMDGSPAGTVPASTPALPEHLQMAGVDELRFNGADVGRYAAQLLDDPFVIQAEQEDYVERYIAPTQFGVPLTPLRVLSSYYDPQSARGVDQLAEAVEKSMNDNGYAKYIRRSPTFFDPSHAARRGYGLEGSIFVVIPFVLSDITPDIVAAITARARAPPSAANSATAAPREAAALRNPLDGADEASAAQAGDAFYEVRRTAARCAMTVESVFRQAHHAIGVTVGTIDVVVVSEVDSPSDIDLAFPADVRRPITEAERVKDAALRKRRYDRITCEPPSFRSGRDDVSYGFSWKDNLRQRRVLVPLAKLASTAHTGAAARGGPSTFELPHVGRYAALQLHRGESYIFFLRPGSAALPNWDVKLRLLYLRTPQHQRAVLSSRPTPAVVWKSLAAAVAKVWTQHPYLLFSSLAGGEAQSTGLAGTAGQSPAGMEKGSHSARNAGAGAAAAPALDWTGRRLLEAFPFEMATWLVEARTESALALWIVTPRWLWPTLVDVVQEWRALSTGTAPAAAAPSQTPSLRDLFSEATLKAILGDGAAATANWTLASVTAAASSVAGTALLHGTGAATAASRPILTASLTEAEVYAMLLLEEKRMPPPAEPISGMSQLSKRNVNAGVNDAAGATGAAAVGVGTGAGMVACGTLGTPLSYYSAKDNALVKRAFEYCWIHHHRAALSTLAERLIHTTKASAILTSPSPHSARHGAGADGAAVRCRGDGQSTFKWYDTKLLPHNRASQCLADMRYLDPSEVPLLGVAKEGTVEEQRVAAAQWFVSPSNAGQLSGDSAVPPQPANVAEREAAATATTTTTTPYVLQSVASADLLFGPAEAFVDIAPEDRLRTRAYTLAEQLSRKQRSATSGPTAAATPEASRYADTPEAVALDPTLHYLDSDALDLYLTTALWTRGWNLFGLTEAVAAGDAAPNPVTAPVTAPVNTTAAPAADAVGSVMTQACGLAEKGNDAWESLPAEVRAAQTFAEEKLQALMAAHHAAGTPLGPVGNLTAQGTPATTRFPLRRTLQAYENFASFKLADLLKK